MALVVKHFNRIGALPEKVWEQFSDVDSWPSWIPTFRGAQWVEGRAVEGWLATPNDDGSRPGNIGRGRDHREC